jgi:predicted kinase
MNQPTLYIMKGLPGSGKTTAALDLVRLAGVKRVSKDDLRAMLHAGEYAPETEPFVQAARDAIVAAALGEGCSVVSDDTNLNSKHEDALRSIAFAFGAQVQVIFMDTPLEECIRRDSLRVKPVGEKTIRWMHKQYLERAVTENPLNG